MGNANQKVASNCKYVCDKKFSVMVMVNFQMMKHMSSIPRLCHVVFSIESFYSPRFLLSILYLKITATNISIIQFSLDVSYTNQ